MATIRNIVAVITLLLIQLPVTGQRRPILESQVKPRVGSYIIRNRVNDTLLVRRPVNGQFSSFASGFQPDDLNYQQRYEQARNDEHQKFCQPYFDARQQVVNQLSRIDKLVGQSAIAELIRQKRKGSLPIVDSLVVDPSGNSLRFLHVRYTLTDGFGCNVPPVNVNSYNSLAELSRQQKLVVEGRFQRFEAATVDRLPRASGDPAKDAQTYLLAIFDLLQVNYAKLKTSSQDYTSYESAKNLTSDPVRLTFRKKFFYYTLCAVGSN